MDNLKNAVNKSIIKPQIAKLDGKELRKGTGVAHGTLYGGGGTIPGPWRISWIYINNE